MENTVKIKICGLKRPEDITIVNHYRPDYIGFVFAGSKRKITPEQAADLKRLLNPSIMAVGVFVNEPIEHIARLCRDNIIDLIQLHGDETDDEIRRLKCMTRKPVIRAVRVRSAQDIVDQADTPADFLLLDAYCKEEYGGCGEGFSRNLIMQAMQELKQAGKRLPDFFLAGGLNAENVAGAIRESGAWAVDVSSGVETDGWKNEKEICDFVEAVRGLRK